MIRVGILGATGYTARELIRILLRHPQVSITKLTSRQEDAPRVQTIHPQFTGQIDLPLENLEPDAIEAECDCVFSCLPHASSAEAIRGMLSKKLRIIDLSADYRLWDAGTYATWYGHQHPDAGRLGSVGYGLPELYRERLRGARIIANPGCYPTSVILALAPLLRGGWVRATDLIFDSKSGVSGAGRSPSLTTHFPECNESLSAYNVGRHRHTPEIVQILSDQAGSEVQLVFTPHLVPMDRGILTTGYAAARRKVTDEELLDCLREFYAREPFVRVVDHFPSTKDVAHSNFCDVTARIVGERVVTISCIDNLVKGAAGAAVQNMNLIFGLNETLALM